MNAQAAAPAAPNGIPDQAAEFQAVYDELDMFCKALEAPKKKVKAKASDEPTLSPGMPPDNADDDDDDDEKSKKSPEFEMMGKSTSASASPGDAGHKDEQVLDGEQVIADFKATLHKSVVGLSAELTPLQNGIAILAKSVQALMRELAVQRDELAAIGHQGRPRKSLLSVVAKSVTGVAEQAPVNDGMTPNDILMKAASCRSLTPADVSNIRQLLTVGTPLPTHYMEAIRTASAAR